LRPSYSYAQFILSLPHRWGESIAYDGPSGVAIVQERDDRFARRRIYGTIYTEYERCDGPVRHCGTSGEQGLFGGKNMKIVVIGAAGLLGRALCRVFSSDWSVIAVTHADVDICDLPHTKELIGHAHPDVVINAAAYTNVDGCESDPERAYSVNTLGACNVAIASRAVTASHVYVSTDYVFDGEKEAPYVESDPPAPLNVYGCSKLAGEREVQRNNPRSFIVRTSWLYGDGGGDYVHAILAAAQARQDLAVASDQHGTPTWVDDLAHQIRVLVLSESFGLYHASAEGSCTRHAFALEILRQAGYTGHPADKGATQFAPKSDPTNTFSVRPTRSEELNRRARRPRNAVLENLSLKAQGLNVLPHWRDSLQAFASCCSVFRGGKE